MRFSVLFMLFLLASVLSTDTAEAKGRYLIPFRKGTHWGMSDEHGTMVLPAKFDLAEYVPPYLFGINNSGARSINIFDASARLIDSCYFCHFLSDTTLLVLKFDKAYTQPKRFHGFGTNAPYPYNSTVTWWEPEFPCTGYILHPHNKREPLPGHIAAMGNGTPLCIMENDGKLGVMNIYDDTTVLPCVCDSITTIKPDWLLCFKGSGPPKLIDGWGAQYPYHPPSSALYVAHGSGNYVLRRKLTPSFRWDTVAVTTDRTTGKPNYNIRDVPKGYIGLKNSGDDLYSPDGRLLIAGERTWEYMPSAGSPRYIRMRKSYDSVKERESVFQMADLDGNILLRSAQVIDQIDSVSYHVQDVGPEKRDICFNIRTKAITDYAPLKNVPHDGKGFNQIDTGGKRTLFNNNGEVIAVVADTTILYHKEWNFIKKIVLKYDDTTIRRTRVYGNTYFAFRSSLREHFTLYDEQYNKINSDYEDLTPFVSSSKWISFKKNGKWGVADNTFKEVVPAIYDKMLTINYNNTAIGEVSGTRYYIDLQTLRRIDMTGLDAIADGSYADHLLGLKYATNYRGAYTDYARRVAMLCLLDTAGHRLDSAAQNDDLPYSYCFTTKGNIIKTLSQDAIGYEKTYAYLLTGLHGQPRRTALPVFSVEKCGGNVLMLQCLDDDQQLTMISANDLSTVVPLGKYSFMFTYPTTFDAIDGSGQKLEMLLIKGGTDAMHDAMNDPANLMKSMMGQPVPASDREDIGYYSMDGKEYWSN
jgi:WG containing repeat